MAEPLTMVSEGVDDSPVLWAQLDRLGVPPLRDMPCPPQGNGGGLSVGWVRVRWLPHRLSAGDPGLNQGAPWATQRLQTLRECSGQSVHPWDVGDERLATVLEAWRDETHGQACEGALHQPTLRVEELQPAGGRRESTTAHGHWTVTEDGRCQGGPSPDHRPDRPQVTILLSALEPLGLPVATDLGPGPRADAPLDLPAIARVREGLGRRGRLDVGDGKMGALETRAYRHAGGDTYVWPVSERQLPPAVLADSRAPVWAEEPSLTVRHRAQPAGPSQLIAAGVERLEPMTAEGAGPL